MKQLSGLQEKLLEEYFRFSKNYLIQKREIEKNCTHGYISRKKIRGKEVFYLQKRENGKIKSRYIRPDELPKIEKEIAKRKLWEESVKSLSSDIKVLQRALGKKLIEEHSEEYNQWLIQHKNNNSIK